MGITLVMGTVYMWWAEVDGFPFGPKEVRKLLMARGFGGFFGRRYLTTATCTSLVWLTNVIAVFGIYCMLYVLLVLTAYCVDTHTLFVQIPSSIYRSPRLLSLLFWRRS